MIDRLCISANWLGERVTAASLNLVLIFAGTSFLSAGQAFAAEPTNWLLSYEGKSTNSFIWDKRSTSLIQSRLPAKLSDGVQRGLGGPPEPVVVVDQRYVSASACVPHDCLDKGFLWVDTKTGIGFGATATPDRLVLGSNGFSSENIPAPARKALTDWISEHDLNLISVEFIGNSGAITILEPSGFTARERFHAPPGGPGFDCGKALSRIEKSICTDPELSKLDLALNNLVAEIRQGTDTTIARAQLLNLQRKWLKDRDLECVDAPEIASCLKNRYNTQYDRLMNWIPTN